MKTVLIIGSTSAIAEAYGRLVAAQNSHIVLVARNPVKLEAQKSDLLARGARAVETHSLDFSDYKEQQSLLDSIFQNQAIDIVLIAHGVMHEQVSMESNINQITENYQVNLLSPITLCNMMIPHFEKQKTGQLAVITSVAGDRGRKTNYIYGSAKAGLQAYVAGLRGRMFHFGVNVLDIRPGFVATPMTAHLKQGPLFSQPEAIAKGIAKALDRQKATVYLPWFWYWIMLIIRNIPERIFKRLSI